MKSPLAVVALTTLVCLSPVIGFADDRGGAGAAHPLIGEPPTPLHLAEPSLPSAPETTGTVSAEEPGLQQALVTSLKGLPVYDRDQNEFGDVAAVLFAGDGAIDTLVVRIGDFPDLGQGAIALPFDLVTTSTDRDGKTMIVVDTAVEEIAGVPRFIGVDESYLPPSH